MTTCVLCIGQLGVQAFVERLRVGRLSEPGLDRLFIPRPGDIAVGVGHAQTGAQFATLEEPGSDEKDVLVVDIANPLDEVVAATVATIKDAINQG